MREIVRKLDQEIEVRRNNLGRYPSDFNVVARLKHDRKLHNEIAVINRCIGLIKWDFF